MGPVGITDIGKHRLNNEDALFVSGKGFHELPNLFIVADGMGGHNAGEVASSEAILFFKDYCSKTPLNKNEILDYLVTGCIYANNRVFEMAGSSKSYSGMGTTFSVCVKDADRLYIAHIGDSRVYAVYDDAIKQLTTDHTYVCELLKLGQITEEQARKHPRRNILTRVLGVERDVEIDGQVFDLSGCKKILLCSDGFTDMLSDGDIFEELRGSNAEAAQRLVDKANERGGGDNITLIIFDTTDAG